MTIALNNRQLTEHPLSLLTLKMAQPLLVKQEVSFQELQTLARQPRNQRVGATVNPENRRKQYRSEGYTGTFYYAQVRNMKAAEQMLLSCVGTGNCPRNVQSGSNAPEGPGYVYAIHS